MKRSYLIFTMVIILVTFYFSLQFINIKYYSDDDLTKQFNDIKKGLVFKDNIMIKTNKNIEDYITFKNIKIKNDFQDFIIASQDENVSMPYVSYVLKDENDNNKAIFNMGISYTYLDYMNMKDEDITLMGDIKKVDDTNRQQFIKDYKIKNDIDLLKFMAQFKYPNFNIITPLVKVKRDYAGVVMFSTFMPKVKNLGEIKGDYEGFILNMDKIKEVHILKDGKSYTFTFFNTDYFSDQYIFELLNTIVIE